MTTAEALELRRFGHDDLAEIRQDIISVHADAYADAMDDEFRQKFPWFVDHWGGHPGFSCVIAYEGDEPMGFAYGAPAKDGRGGRPRSPSRSCWSARSGARPEPPSG